MASSVVRVPNPHATPRTERLAPEFASWCSEALGQGPSAMRKRLEEWLEEDHGGGCVTTWGAIGAREATAVILAKEEFTLCGLPLACEVFRLASDGAVRVYSDLSDGAVVHKGEVILAARGAAGCLLLAERVALNLASRLSGVSTYTRGVVTRLAEEAVRQGNTPPDLLETRKTTPGLRVFEKYATRVGGARNHRHGLDTGAMLKENHLRAVGDLREALRRLKATVPVLTKIEIEVTSLEEFRVALEEGADVVMLDNFSAADVRAAVALRDAAGGRARGPRLEVSGNLDRRDPAELVSFGVDSLSMGALIHKAPWVDMSLQLYVEEAR